MNKPAITTLVSAALFSFTISVGFSMAPDKPRYFEDGEKEKKNIEKTGSRGDALIVSRETEKEDQVSPSGKNDDEKSVNWEDCTKADFDRE